MALLSTPADDRLSLSPRTWFPVTDAHGVRVDPLGVSMALDGVAACDGCGLLVTAVWLATLLLPMSVFVMARLRSARQSARLHDAASQHEATACEDPRLAEAPRFNRAIRPRVLAERDAASHGTCTVIPELRRTLDERTAALQRLKDQAKVNFGWVARNVRFYRALAFVLSLLWAGAAGALLRARHIMRPRSGHGGSAPHRTIPSGVCASDAFGQLSRPPHGWDEERCPASVAVVRVAIPLAEELFASRGSGAHFLVLFYGLYLVVLFVGPLVLQWLFRTREAADLCHDKISPSSFALLVKVLQWSPSAVRKSVLVALAACIEVQAVLEDCCVESELCSNTTCNYDPIAWLYTVAHTTLPCFTNPLLGRLFRSGHVFARSKVPFECGLLRDAMVAEVRAETLIDTEDEAADEERLCAVCQEHISTKALVGDLECRHLFHSSCLLRWRNADFRRLFPACPVCATRLPGFEVPPFTSSAEHNQGSVLIPSNREAAAILLYAHINRREPQTPLARRCRDAVVLVADRLLRRCAMPIALSGVSVETVNTVVCFIQMLRQAVAPTMPLLLQVPHVDERLAQLLDDAGISDLTTWQRSAARGTLPLAVMQTSSALASREQRRFALTILSDLSLTADVELDGLPVPPATPRVSDTLLIIVSLFRQHPDGRSGLPPRGEELPHTPRFPAAALNDILIFVASRHHNCAVAGVTIPGESVAASSRTAAVVARLEIPRLCVEGVVELSVVVAAVSYASRPRQLPVTVTYLPAIAPREAPAVDRESG